MLASSATMRARLNFELLRLAPLALLALVSSACGAVYPEVATPVRQPPPGREVIPEPPPDLLYITFDKATIPKQTRDGRKWDSVGGNAPDPFAKLIVDGQELILTPVQANTLHPTWPDQKRANYKINPQSKVMVELWDSNPINNNPICRKSISEIHSMASSEPEEILCNSGARIELRVEHARPVLGLGMFYELQSQAVRVTRVVEVSPAARAGLAAGVMIRKIQGKKVDSLDSAEAKSLINANAPTGLELTIEYEDGTQRDVSLKEEAMYPQFDEGVDLPFR